MSYVYGNTTRLTGLASGMDTDTIIKNLMSIEQLKVNKQLRSQTLLQWQQESLTTVKTSITDFASNYLSVLGQNSMLKSSSYIRFNAETTDKSGAVSIAAGSENTAKSVTINQVQQLATATKAQSKLKSDGTNQGTVMTEPMAEGNYVALKDLKLENALAFDSSGNVSFEINGETFTFNENDTLQHMLSTVSGNEKAGVVFNYSRLSNTFTLTSKKMGTEGELTFRNVSGNAFGESGAFQIGADQKIQGVNAKVTIDGVTIERSSNNFTIDGINYTLNKVTAMGADITFAITEDYQSAVDAMKEFVSGYNTLIKKLEELVVERKGTNEKGYTPLTEEEKSNMTDKQVEQWEAIAKKGLLYNDRDIQSLLTTLRNNLYATIEGTGMSAAQMGLKTGDYRLGHKGEIVLDEDAFKAALAKDSAGVLNAFMKTPTTIGGSDGGFMFNLQNIFNGYTKVTQQNTLDGIKTKLTAMAERITDMEKRMASVEQAHYLKFAAMEKALGELQNQSNNLAGLVAQMSGK